MFRLTPVTATVGVFTVTVQLAVLLPSAVFTIIVAVPAAFPVTTPFDTVATFVFVLLHVTFLFVALLGVTVAVRVSLFPTSIVVDVLFRFTPVTATIGVFTVTVQLAVLLPSAVFTVIVAVPAAFPVTTPFDTSATFVFVLLHVTFLFVALLGVTVAVSVSLFPTSIVVDALFKLTPVTFLITVKLTVFDFTDALAFFAVITAV